jgi:hypothetical protein
LSSLKEENAEERASLESEVKELEMLVAKFKELRAAYLRDTKASNIPRDTAVLCAGNFPV